MAVNKCEKFTVGNLNSGDVFTIPELFAGENLNNYSVVELAYNSEQVREMKYATATGNEFALLCAVEVVYDPEADFLNFYVAEGEDGRAVWLKQGLRFETSNVTEDTLELGKTKGNYAQWNATEKQFEIVATKPTGTVGDLVFEVVDFNTTSYGVPMVRFEVK